MRWRLAEEKKNKSSSLCFPFSRTSGTPLSSPSFLPFNADDLPSSLSSLSSLPTHQSLGCMAARSYLPTIQSDISLDWERVNATSPKSPSSPLSPGSDGTGRINAGAFWKSRNSQGEGMDKVSQMAAREDAFEIEGRAKEQRKRRKEGGGQSEVGWHCSRNSSRCSCPRKVFKLL